MSQPSAEFPPPAPGTGPYSSPQQPPVAPVELQPYQAAQAPVSQPYAPGPPPGAPGSAAALIMLRQKSAGVAAILSLLLTGAGQWYCGKVGRGIAFLVAAMFSWLLCFVLIGFFLLPIVWIWALVDAISLANRHNVALAEQVVRGPYA